VALYVSVLPTNTINAEFQALMANWGGTAGRGPGIVSILIPFIPADSIFYGVIKVLDDEGRSIIEREI
jgi:hypothetical protein